VLLLLCFSLAWTSALAAEGAAKVRVVQQVTVDSLDAEQDTTEVEPFVPRNLTARPEPIPVGWASGVWEWDTEALRSTRAITILELLQEVPGVVPLRAGDYGQPASATAFGSGAGRVRLYLDGIEMPPLDGGVVDLARTGLAGLDRVRVERRPGELRVHLFPLEFTDPRPYSFLEVGTGDLSTNLFRGVFGHPSAFGGNILVALDRIDTQGPGRQEPGTSSGAHVRHTLFRGERLGVAWDFRTMTSKRPRDLWRPSKVGRTDLGVRSRYEWTDWLQVGAFLRNSSLSSDTTDVTGATLEDIMNGESRSQLGAHISASRGGAWLDATYQRQGGPGWASSDQEIRGGGTRASIGGATFGVERQGWSGGENAVSYHARAWTRAVLGVSFFGEIEDGRLGVPFFVPPQLTEDPDPGEQPPKPAEVDPPQPPSFSQGTGVRMGIEIRRRDARFGAALLSIDQDSLHALGLPTDRGGVPSAGGSRSGSEISLDLPLSGAITGLSLRGSAQFWDKTDSWPYVPERIYEGRLSLHDVFFDSESLELWVAVGARGRDPMSLPAQPQAAANIVPFQQSWYAQLQVRVSSVRLFFLWENLTVRDKNQDYLGRIQPRTRAMYGIRWTMWN